MEFCGGGGLLDATFLLGWQIDRHWMEFSQRHLSAIMNMHVHALLVWNFLHEAQPTLSVWLYLYVTRSICDEVSWLMSGWMHACITIV